MIFLFWDASALAKRYAPEVGSDTVFYNGIALIDKHNLNATDAALVITFQAYKAVLASDSTLRFILVAADERLERPHTRKESK